MVVSPSDVFIRSVSFSFRASGLYVGKSRISYYAKEVSPPTSEGLTFRMCWNSAKAEGGKEEAEKAESDSSKFRKPPTSNLRLS